MSTLFNAVFYQPLYNGLIFLFDALPWADAGVIVVLFTVVVKLCLFPFSYKSVKTQLQMKKYEPELKRIREEYKDKQEQALKVMEFYKEKSINPFVSLFIILIQLPIIFALYRIFLKSGLPSVNQELLYPFVSFPDHIISMQFLGILDIAGKSLLLALLAAVSSYLQLKFSVPPMPKRETNATFKDDLARTMNLQMRYVFPVIVFFISFNISGAVALYWLTSNLFTIGQELYVKKKLGGRSQEAAA